jgi:hypothetical protein
MSAEIVLLAIATTGADHLRERLLADFRTLPKHVRHRQRSCRRALPPLCSGSLGS